MAEHWFFVIEALLFTGAALAWAGWELWSLRRERKRDASRQARHPEGQ